MTASELRDALAGLMQRHGDLEVLTEVVSGYGSSTLEPVSGVAFSSAEGLAGFLVQ